MSVYTLSAFLASGVPFLVLPILTIYLEPADYAIISLFSALEKFLMSIIGLGLVETIGVQFFKRKKHEFAEYNFVGIALASILTLLITIVLCFLPPEALEFIKVPRLWLLLVPVTCLLFLVHYILLVIVRSLDRAKLFAAISIALAILEATMTVVFVVGLLKGWEGRILSHIFSGMFICSAALIYLSFRGYIKTTLNRTYINGILLSGLALLPDGMSVFALELSDRFFIANMVNLSETGIYSVGSLIAMVTLLFVRSFINAFYPEVYKVLQVDTKEGLRQIVRKTYFMLTLTFVSVLFVSFVISPIVFNFFLEKSYIGGGQYVFWISLGYFFLAIYAFFKVYCLQSGKVYFVTITSTLMIVLNLALNYFLIGQYGTIGAAYATCLSYFSAAVLMVYFGNKSKPMPWFG